MGFHCGIMRDLTFIVNSLEKCCVDFVTYLVPVESVFIPGVICVYHSVI